MDRPLVSVIVPIYNAERYITECIESILRQTYRNIEILLVDDYSSDKSVDICEKYVKNENRVKFLRQPSQGGVSKARNCGLSKADGRFVCFVDADDFIDDDYIEKMVELIIEKKVPVVFARCKYYQDGTYMKRPIRVQEGLYNSIESSDSLIDDGTLTGILFGSVCWAIYDIEIIRRFNINFDEKLTRNEDGVFNLEILSQNIDYYVVGYDGYSYRQWKNNKKIPAFEYDSGLKKSTDVIRKKFKSFRNYKLQMMRRTVSIVFWNAIKIGQCSGGFIENYRRLKQYIDQNVKRSDYKTLNHKAVGKYKRILIELLYRKHLITFYILMKYVFPVMQRFR